MKRKYLLITLIDGSEHEHDIENLANMVQVPIGAPASHQGYLTLAQLVATKGFCPSEKANPPTWIAPSQIKKVSIVIEGLSLTVSK
jgi:hypothetical protein